MSFQYVYLLESEQPGDHHDVDLTEDLKARLAKHNHGEVPHTAKFRAWVLKVAVAFREREEAAAFERYLKSHSSRAFGKHQFR